MTPSPRRVWTDGPDRYCQRGCARVIARSLRYPFGPNGRIATLMAVTAVMAVAVGFRYTAAFAPSVPAVVAAVIATVGLVVLAGELSQVLLSPERVGSLSVRSSLRAGAVALTISTITLVPPILLLVSTFSDAAANPPTNGGSGIVLLIGSTLSVLYFLASLYVLPVLIAVATSGDAVRSGFERDVVVPVLRDLSYLSRWTVGLTLAIPAVGLAATSVRSGGPVGLLSAALAAVLVVASARVTGTGYATALGSRTID